MPKGHWGHGSIRYSHNLESHRLFLQLEGTPDISRYEMRLAAEVILCKSVDPDQQEAFEIAERKAFNIFHVLAKG